MAEREERKEVDEREKTRSAPVLWTVSVGLAASVGALLGRGLRGSKQSASGKKNSGSFGPSGNSFNDGSTKAKREATSRPHGGGSGLHEKADDEFDSFIEPEETLAADVDGSGKNKTKIEHARGNSGNPKLRHRDPDEKTLSGADDRVNFQTWPPPRKGRAPEVRIFKWWVNCFWLVPIGAFGLIFFIAASQGLRETAWWQHFVALYPGQPLQAPKVHTGYPWWLRLQHYVNMFFMFFIIRAGIQILADHPRLYWDRDCTPGTEWFRFQHPVPKDRIWTSKDDAVSLPRWLGIPGLRHSIGIARWWHFTLDMLWLINGIIFFVLLFVTDQWIRVVPVTWTVFPNALSEAIQYASLHFAYESTWERFNGLQQLTYFITIFVATPVSIFTGLLQAPSLSNKLGIVSKVLHRQAARSIHFISMAWFVFFIAAHGIMVFATSLRENTNHMFAGVDSRHWDGLAWFIVCMLAVEVSQWAASPFTIKHTRLVQHVGGFMIGWLKGAVEWFNPTEQFREDQISPRLWPNGKMPEGPDYDAMLENDFADYRLTVTGLVDNPREFSMAELQGLPKQDQITKHYCIQGWSGVAKWSGVRMEHILDIVKPKPNAKFVAFFSLSDGEAGGTYYDVHEMKNMHHSLTILAYGMNNHPLKVLHGAPLRLRVENELGFKMVKWIKSIEFIEDFHHLGAGQGGYHEDHEFYGYRMPI